MPRHLRFTLPRTLLLLLLLCLMTAPAHAAQQYCVGNSSELSSALATASILGQSSEIRVRQGTYSMPNGTGTLQFPGNLTISGGWNSGCTSRSLDPTTTTVNGQGNIGSKWMLNSNASITLQGLRFVNNARVSLNDRIDPECTASGQKIIVRRTIIDGGTDVYALALASHCHAVRVENSLIVNSSDTGILLQCGDSMTYQLVNNTVRDATGPGVYSTPFFLAPCAGAAIGLNRMYNNLIDKVTLDDAQVLAHNNIFDQITTTGGGGLFPGSSDNPVADPQLDADYRPIEPGSPAINSGTDNVLGGLPGTDIEGGPRVVGGTPDRGAYESSVVPPGPFVITVTSGGDSGPGTLRQAITQANAGPGLNLIQFDLPGCVFQIHLQSALPDITDDVIINGYSQPGASFNSFDDGNNAVLCVRLLPDADIPWAFRVPSNSDATLKVRGILFNGFDAGGGLFGEAAIYLQGGSGHQIQGNHFGGLGIANSEGVRLMNNATSALIGGSDPANRNTFSNSTFAAIDIIGPDSGNHQIINNYIGTTPSGTSAASNQDGIRIVHSADNQVLDNLISGNTRDGVVIYGENATGNVVGGNRIGDIRAGIFLCGFDPLPPCPVLTNRKGVFIDGDASDNLIGQATQSGAPNRIRYSTQHGVRVLSGQQNRIWNNSIFDNGLGANELDIDLGNFGLDPIDADCGATADGNANRGQNRPVLGAAQARSGHVSISGELTSCTHTGSFDAIYRLEFFASPSCAASGYGPGRTYLGTSLANLPGAAQTEQTATFNAELDIAGPDLTGQAITATATDLSGNTSEFSHCVTATFDDIIFADGFENVVP